MSDSRLARSFDRAAEDYERGRPGWPIEALDAVEIPSGAIVLDLGAGTGKLTRLLVPRFRRVVAVEPLEGMRELLAVLVPQAEVIAGSAEAIPLQSDSVDAVFCAEAFHWFDGDRALPEIVRVLRPRGVLVLLWNRQARPTKPRLPKGLTNRINTLYQQAEHPMKGYESGEWQRAFEAAVFEPLRESQFENPQRLDRDGMIAFFASMSWITTLPDGAREQLLADARALLDADEYVRPWRTELFWTRLRD